MIITLLVSKETKVGAVLTMDALMGCVVSGSFVFNASFPLCIEVCSVLPLRMASLYVGGWSSYMEDLASNL